MSTSRSSTMSCNDKNKEEHEHECLCRAISLGKDRKDKTGEILTYLDGDEIERSKKDSPDLVRLCMQGKKASFPVIVGIEHFQVHKMSKKKGKKYISTGLDIQSRVWNTYEKGHEELLETGDASENSKDQLINNIAKYSDELFRRDYQSFINAFRFHLSHHLEQVERYRHNLATVANGRKIEIALLIEMRTYFPTLVLNDGAKEPQKTSHLLPICTEMVEELNKIDKELVNYIVLYSVGDPLLDSKTNQESVIAIQTGNIKKHLLAQHIPTYKYIEGYFSNGNLSTRVTAQKDNKGNYTIGRTGPPEKDRIQEIEKSILSGVYQLSIAQKNKKPYVTTIDVQSHWDAIKNFVAEFIPYNDEYIIKFNNKADIGMIMKRYDNAREKYKAMDKGIHDSEASTD